LRALAWPQASVVESCGLWVRKSSSNHSRETTKTKRRSARRWLHNLTRISTPPPWALDSQHHTLASLRSLCSVTCCHNRKRSTPAKLRRRTAGPSFYISGCCNWRSPSASCRNSARRSAAASQQSGAVSGSHPRMVSSKRTRHPMDSGRNRLTPLRSGKLVGCSPHQLDYICRPRGRPHGTDDLQVRHGLQLRESGTWSHHRSQSIPSTYSKQSMCNPCPLGKWLSSCMPNTLCLDLQLENRSARPRGLSACEICCHRYRKTRYTCSILAIAPKPRSRSARGNHQGSAHEPVPLSSALCGKGVRPRRRPGRPGAPVLDNPRRNQKPFCKRSTLPKRPACNPEPQRTRHSYSCGPPSSQARNLQHHPQATE